MRSSNGVSDILGIYRTCPLAIEVKRPGGVVSAEQAKFLQEFSDAGGVAIVAHSVEEVIEQLGVPCEAS